MFITFEGCEGAGKGTQVELLSRRLAERRPVERRPVVVREPGGTALGERVRRLVLEEPAPPIAPAAEMYLFLAARAQLVEEVIRPALAEGRIVIADRYHDSTLAYQGGARGLDVGWPAEFPRPDVTFLLALPVGVGLARRRQAGDANRMEGEELRFHEDVAAAYDRLAEAEPGRWVRLDGLLPPDQVHELVVERLEAMLEVPGSS